MPSSGIAGTYDSLFFVFKGFSILFSLVLFCAPSPAGFLISFSSLIVVARIFKSMLCNSLIPDFRGNAFSFSVLRVFDVDLSFVGFIMFRYVASWASLVVQKVKHVPAMQETLVQSLGW